MRGSSFTYANSCTVSKRFTLARRADLIAAALLPAVGFAPTAGHKAIADSPGMPLIGRRQRWEFLIRRVFRCVLARLAKQLTYLSGLRSLLRNLRVS